MPREVDISVIVPCYNSARVLAENVRALAEYLDGLDERWELLVVDDGSTDGTRAAAAGLANGFTDGQLQVISHEHNCGKGRSVRDGMLAARGRYRVFIDVDLDYRPFEIGRIVAALRAGADVAIASRVASGARMTISPWHIQYLFTRHLMSRLLNKIFRNIFVRGVTDSQAGLKGFTAAAAEAVFSRLTINRFSFDVECLYIARLLGLKIVEIPVHFIYGMEPSTVNFVKAGFQLLYDLMKIRINGARGTYNCLDGDAVSSTSRGGAEEHALQRKEEHP